MMLTAIVAMAQNRVIGKDNDLIWRLPNDLKHFKKLTNGHTIVMGRKTWESIGSRPLPNRNHIVITRNASYKANGATVVDSLEKALELAKTDDQPFIVGGGEIYRMAMPFLKRLEITEVHHSFEGDTLFPDFDTNEWKLSAEEKHTKDEKHAYDFTFLRYERV